MSLGKAERQFKSRYPNAWHKREHVHGSIVKYTVFAGDYICAESLSKRTAYALALDYVDQGLITPDPNEIGSRI